MSHTAAQQTATPAAAGKAASVVSLRAVLLGLTGVLFICGLTPYNDYVLDNTFLVGNFLPIGLVLFMLLLVLGVNALLHRLIPSRALRGGEMAVILGMTLISCTLPSSGLMRYLPATLVGVYQHAGIDGDYGRIFRELNLPDWMFPRFESDRFEDRVNDPVLKDYWGRVQIDQPNFRSNIAAVPWRAWAMPALTWGVLLVFVYGAVLCLTVALRRQWVENERLAFPIASVYLSLIEPPEKGRLVNALFRARSFWISLGLVFLIHSTTPLNQYYPRYIPRIPINFDLNAVFSEGNLQYVAGTFKASRIFFCVVGVVFFLQTKLAFSVWCFFALHQLVNVGYGIYGAEFARAAQQDQMFGAVVAYGLLVLWIGRGQWWLILRQMVRGPREREPRGRYLPYPVAGWGLLLCCAGIVAWLMAVGASLVGSVVLVFMLLLTFVVVARVAAETGLVFVQFQAALYRPWIFALTELPTPVRTTPQSFFMSAWFHNLFTNDSREMASVYSTHALRVADDAAYRQGGAASPYRFMLVLALALIVGYFIAGVSSLYIQYNYASTRSMSPVAPVNPWGLDTAPRDVVLAPTRDYLPPRTGPAEAHSRRGHFGLGVALTTGLAALQWRFVNWPLHPIGYLLMYTWPIHHTWFSIFLGWLAKVLVVRFGGARGFRAGRPFFIGLVVGEAATAAFWLIVSLVRDSMGLSYYAVRLLPG
jgi:hypothetical protein